VQPDGHDLKSSSMLNYVSRVIVGFLQSFIESLILFFNFSSIFSKSLVKYSKVVLMEYMRS
jgi:hypothetical protein